MMIPALPLGPVKTQSGVWAVLQVYKSRGERTVSVVAFASSRTLAWADARVLRSRGASPNLKYQVVRMEVK